EAPPAGRMTVGLVSFMRAVRGSRVARHHSRPWLSLSHVGPVALSRIASPRSLGRVGDGRRAAIVGGVFLLGLLDPGGVLLLAHHVHGDRHESVVAAAELRALAVIDAFALGLEPGL